jgi:hypothetical protein
MLKSNLPEENMHEEQKVAETTKETSKKPSEIIWIKGFFPFPDYVLGEEGILVIRPAPFSLFLILNTVLGSIFVIENRQINAAIVFITLALSLVAINGLASWRRKRFVKLEYSELLTNKAFTHILWNAVQAFEVKGGPFFIGTYDKRHYGWMGESDISRVKQFVQSRTMDKNKIKVFQRRWEALAASIALLLLSLGIVLLLPATWIFVVASLSLLCASIANIAIFVMKLKPENAASR